MKRAIGIIAILAGLTAGIGAAHAGGAGVNVNVPLGSPILTADPSTWAGAASHAVTNDYATGRVEAGAILKASGSGYDPATNAATSNANQGSAYTIYALHDGTWLYLGVIVSDATVITEDEPGRRLDRSDYVEFYFERNNAANHTNIRYGGPPWGGDWNTYPGLFGGGVSMMGSLSSPDWVTHGSYLGAGNPWSSATGVENNWTNGANPEGTQTGWAHAKGTWSGGWFVNIKLDLATLGQTTDMLGFTCVVKDRDATGTDDDNNRNWFAAVHNDYIFNGPDCVFEDSAHWGTLTMTWPVVNTNTGQGYGTIQAAIDAASPGNEIHVAAGTFAETVVCKKSLKLVGAGCDQSLWTAATATGIPLQIQRDSVSPASIDLEISGFKLQTQQNQLIYAEWNPTYTQVLTLDIHGNCFEHINTPWDLYSGQDFGVYVYGASQTARATVGAIRVRNNTFSTHGGVLFENCRAVDVIENDFDVLAEGVIFNYYDVVATYGQQLVQRNDIHLTGASWAEGGLGMNNWYGAPGTYTVMSNVVEENAVYGNNVWWAMLYGVEAPQTSIHDYRLFNNSIGGDIVVWGDDSSTVLLNASGNWWGSNAAPDVVAKAGTNVDYTPWLNRGDDRLPATPGFQGYFDVLNVSAASPQVPPTYGRIQEAIDLTSGSTINVLPGTYVENITVSQSVAINGAGAGLTKVIPATSAPGGDSGPSLGGSQVFVIQAHDVTISNLTVDGNNPDPLITSSITRNGVDIDARNGIIEADGPWNNLVVHDCTVKNVYLRGIYARSGGSGFNIHDNIVQNVDGGPSSIAIFNFGGSGIIENNDVSFASDAISANWSRGTQFLHNTVTQSGSGVHTDNNGGSGGVADLIHDNHVSDLSANGYGVWVFFPYVNTVVEENSITDADIGLFAWGGSGGTATFSNNVVSSPSRPGSIGAYVTAGPDYWGSYQSNVAANFSGNEVSNVAYGFIIETDEVTPFFSATVASSGDSWTGTVADIGVAGLGTFGTTGLLGDTVYVFNPGKIQVGVDVAAPGVGVVTVAPGLYAEYVVVNKSISLLGPTAGVSKVGYTVPANYAWNTAVEAVISNPTPQPTGDVQVVDIAADDVVFKGFIVESLNAPAASANDQLLRINAGSNGVRDGVVVQNNIIGPNTNVSGQTGTNGRMGLYFASPSYPPGGGITNTLVSGNKIFDCRGNGNNVFVWGSAASYASPSRADYSGTVIENNEIYGSHRSGIEIAGGVSGLTIRNNSIFGNSSQVNGAAYDANLKWGNGIAVIRMGGDKTRCDAMGVDGLTITGNLFRDNEKNGIYFGPIASNCSMTGNSFFDNGQDGIRVDLTEAYYGGSATPCYDQTGPIVASGNRIYNNGAGASVIGTPTNVFFLNAINNFWGSGEGPYNEIGTFEVSPESCGTVSVNDMQNVLPAGELGNAVSENVAYCPWSRTLAQLTLESNATCYTTSGAEVVVNIVLDEEVAIDEILGGQFFLAYDKLALDFVSATPAPTFFVQEVYESVNETAGTIDYAVGVLQGSPGYSGTGPILMATMRFHAIDQACNEPDLVTFRPTSPYITCLTMKLGGTAIPVKPQGLNNLNAISLDWTAPTIGTPASGQTVECDGAGNIAALSAWLAGHGGAAANDVCGSVVWTNNFTTLSDLCGATGAATVTFTATDACGNFSTTTATFTITDTTAPTITTAAGDLTVECDGVGNTAALNAWLASHGGAAANDVCGSVVWTNNFTSLSDLCGATGAATVTFTATDACGNFSTTTATFTITDTTAPTITTAAGDLTVECDGAGNTAALSAWLAGHGGAAASDMCGSVAWTNDFTSLSDLCGATGAATVTFTATDACGNFSTTTATFTITDATAPTITTAAGDATVECDGAGNTAALNAWLAGHGGAAAGDVCGSVTWTNDFTALSDLCGATGAATVTFTATDDCGNVSTTTATFTITDTTAPVIDTCPSNMIVNADAGECTASVTFGGATAHDLCGDMDPIDPITYWIGGTKITSPHSFAGGTTTVTVKAKDACGNINETCSFTVTVRGYSDFVVNVQIEGLTAPVTRCVKFTFANCPSGTPVVLEKNLNFVGGMASETFTGADGVACGLYDCVTAEDTLHTLLVKVAPSISGVQYVANFTGSDMLKTGDYYNDNLVDIVDFGVLIAQWGANYDSNGDLVTDGHTPCGVFAANMHADANGDGVLDLSDYTWISTNFLALGDNECCISPFASPQPRRSITVAELLRLGVRRAGRADLNRDGVVDMTDVQLFLNGTIPNDGGYGDIDPTPVPSGKGPKLSTSGNQAPMGGLQPKPR